MSATLRKPQSTDYQIITEWFDSADAVRLWAGPAMPYPFTAEALEGLLQKPQLALESISLVDANGTLCGFGQYWRPTPLLNTPEPNKPEPNKREPNRPEPNTTEPAPHTPLENSVHVGRIAIAPDRRGQGLGRILITLILADIKANTTANTATLRVYRSNLAAVALYTQLGFTSLDAHSNDELLFMAKSLT